MVTYGMWQIRMLFGIFWVMDFLSDLWKFISPAVTLTATFYAISKGSWVFVAIFAAMTMANALRWNKRWS